MSALADIDWIGILNSVITVVAFVAFLGIVVWAMNPRRKAQFDDAANAPFALPDDGVDAKQRAGEKP